MMCVLRKGFCGLLCVSSFILVGCQTTQPKASEMQLAQQGVTAAQVAQTVDKAAKVVDTTEKVVDTAEKVNHIVTTVKALSGLGLGFSHMGGGYTRDIMQIAKGMH